MSKREIRGENPGIVSRLRAIWSGDAWVRPYFGRYGKTLAASLALGVLTLVFATMLMFVSGFLISYASLPPELGLFSLFIPIGFVQIFGVGKPFFGYFERLTSHDWVLRMTSDLRRRLYCLFEADGLVGAQLRRAGDALGLLSQDIGHVQNLYLRTVFPLVIAWILGGLVVLALGLMSLPCACMLLLGFVVIGVLLPLQALLVDGARMMRAKELRAALYASAYDNVMGIGDWVYSQRADDYHASVAEVAAQIDALEARMAAASRRRGLVLHVVFALLTVGMLLWAGGYFGVSASAGESAGAVGLAASLADGQAGNWIAAFVLGFFPLLEAFQPLPDAAVEAAGHLDAVERLNGLSGSGSGAASMAAGAGAPAGEPLDGLADCPEPADATLRLEDVRFAYGATAVAGAADATAPGAAAMSGPDAVAGCDMAGSDSELLLDGVSLTVPPGQKLAVLGASGSGKSTLLHVIRGDLRPQSGVVTLGGVPVARLNELGRMPQHVGYLQQSSYLFAQSLYGNLKVGNPRATREQAEAALRAVELGPLLDRLPDGLDTQLDEAGMRFSGGERQRIALARLLLADVPVVLLDEPTVGLDPLTESKLLRTVFDVLADKTVVMVTHHLQGVEHMDRVVFLDGGRVVLDGAPAELERTSPLFRQLLAFDRGASFE
ncbi:MAG: thiol reductant ABC exporter subunit CydC [Coriobacteriia bacterium]|nr:thiol reductant ABC exporter subunit CydC [Coriobacteriia bacterium]